MPERGAEQDGQVLEVEARKQQIVARVEALDAAATLEYLEFLCTRWHVERNQQSYADIVSVAFHNFGMDPMGFIDVSASEGAYGLRALDDEINVHEMESIAMYHHMRKLELVGQEHEDAPLRLAKIQKVLEFVYYARRIVLSAFQAQLAIHQMQCADIRLDDDLDAMLGSLSLRFRWIKNSELTEMQEVLLFLLDCAFERKLRKQESYVYEPILVGGRYNSHAFKQLDGKLCDMEAWVHSVTSKELQYQQWYNITKSPGTFPSVVKYLISCNDYQFPVLIKCRNVFSFRNGIYLSEQRRFVPYTSTEVIPENIIAAKYFNMDFVAHDDAEDWLHIPTPTLQSVLDYQDLPDEAVRWFYIFLGRLLYDLNTHDGWQVIPFLKGHAGTGKSTICELVASFYDALDVGTLSNNMEKKFGLSAFYDKFVFIGPECRSDMAIEQAEFQSIVSGEDVSINTKYKTASSVRWKVPGLLAGNEVPSWADSQGSIQRRVPIFDFPKPVVNGDMRLKEKMHAEMPQILLKINRAYRDTADRCGADNVWNHLGDYFKRTAEDLAKTVNVLEAFMASDEVIFHAEKYVPLEELKSAISTYAATTGFRRPRFNADYFRAQFARRNITTERCSRVWGGAEVHREFVMGLTLRTAGGYEM